MARNHASVNYVEPNVSAMRFWTADESGNSVSSSWVNDDYNRTPRLEDYCMMVNLEVEVCSRNNISANERISSEVLVMSYKSNNKTGESTVSFFSGTKIKCNDKDDSSVNFLTTNYADMYVGDLVDYGTTEMIGIKSIDVEYEKSCIPRITIRFTDVRGMSLFQPTELSRVNAYEGIKGLNKDNVAQSFFQCFFRLPMPKFTITIKGFYGKPVTYEVMCDKFETQFNSSTGDFDITAKFIGYSYSFLTDISIDALLSAPYSDYGGLVDNMYNSYWVRERDETKRFFVWDMNHTNKLPMPTLIDIWKEYDTIAKNKEEFKTSLTEEEKTHADEISRLDTIRKDCEAWYTTLYNLLCEKYGEKYCYLMDDGNKDLDYLSIVILASDNPDNPSDLSSQYEQFNEDFKKINENLYTEIDTFNNDGGSITIQNVSRDFSAYTLQPLFRHLFISPTTKAITFDGFDSNCTLNETNIINSVFYGVEYEEEEGATEESVAIKKEQNKNNVLKIIYNDGATQFVKAYVINFDYSNIKSRINTLQVDANRPDAEKTEQKKLDELNKRLLSNMSWYPTVENFTRVMIAHLETLMYMMYNVTSNAKGRTAAELGVTVGSDGDCIDVPHNADEIPPFPRVVREILGSDNITKFEDTWVGEYTNGTRGFEEVDFINGLLNGVEKIRSIMNDHIKAMADKEKNEEESDASSKIMPALKFPLSSFDFFITKNPYGDISEINNDKSGQYLIGQAAIRMFNILCINHFILSTSNLYKTSSQIEMLGRVEAHNFCDKVLLSEQIRAIMRDGKTFEWENILKVLTGSDDKHPWGGKPLFRNDSKLGLWLDHYYIWKPNKNSGKDEYVNSLYPIQNASFSYLDGEIMNYANQGGITANEDISMARLPKSAKVIPNSINGFGNIMIYDDYKRITETITNATSQSCNVSGYDDFLGNSESGLTKYASFDSDEYYSYFATKPERTSFCSKLLKDNPKVTSVGFDRDSKVFYFKINGERIPYECAASNQVDVFDENNDISSNFTTSEIFGINTKTNKIDYDTSMFSTYWAGGGNGEKDGFEYLRKVIVNDTFKDIDGIDSYLARMVLCMPTPNFDKKFFELYTVGYFPRIVVLKIGAIILGGKSIFLNNGKQIKDECVKNKLPLDDLETYGKLFDRIASLSPQVKYAYAKYFVDWAKRHHHFFDKTTSLREESETYYSKIHKKTEEVGEIMMIAGMGGTVTYQIPTEKKESTETYPRRLLREGTSFNNEFTNEMMGIVCIEKLSINARGGLASSAHSISLGSAEIYFNSFIDELKKINMIDYTEDSSGNIIKMTSEPKKSTTDMKKELYRYMKQLYDKWVPMSPLSTWQMESFFDDDGGEQQGHKFYFMDSYYNYIGDKLLVNPKQIFEKISAIFQSDDINTMMLGFMSDVYAFNRCMLMCIQNFNDLIKQNSMNEMFTPMPYNSIYFESVNKYPSFVVVYTYEPSKNLNVANNEYNDDTFMLNDEEYTPIAIKSKNPDNNKGQYRIPAFGVTYGRQYQSYFKSVDVNMNSPIATEQSIRVKHMILREQAAGERTAAAQDLYDIYTTQSYTCSVTMMGCAWVQPLMYFVLLNVPMFRGSYMIMKVKHSIRPGDMTTTFLGCRMANVSTSLVKNIFTDSEYGENNGYDDVLEKKNQAASIDNDCPYKIYPLWGDENVEISKDEMENARNAMSLLINTYQFSKAAAAGICGNIFQESTWNLYAGNSYGAFGLCQWRLSRKKLLIEKYGNRPTFNQQIEYINSEWNDSSIVGRDGRKILMEQSSAKDAALVVRKKFEKPGENEANDETRINAANRYYNAYVSNSYSSSSQPSSKDPNDKKDVIDAFFDAVNKSAQYTPSIGVELKKDIYTDKNKVKYLKITQANGSGKLSNVFDLILNSEEYYKYVEMLGWTYPNGGLETSVEPLSLYCLVKEKVAVNKKKVYAAEERSTIGDIIGNFTNDTNPKILKALAKRYSAVTNEVPQLNNISALEKYKPQDCDSMFSTSSGGEYQIGGTNRKKAIESLGFSKNPTKKECDEKMITIKVKGANGELNLTIHKDLQDEVKKIYSEIYGVGFKVKTTCGYCFRTINNPSHPNSKVLSMHSFGCAIDINPDVNPFVKKGRPQSNGDTDTKIRTNNSQVVRIFAKYGWGWGGKYGDYMHFSKASGD